MKTVSFANVLAGVCARLGWDFEHLDADEFSRARQAVAEALDEIQRAAWWPQVIKTEIVQYADDYAAGTAYIVGEVVYDPLSDAYYQAVRPALDQFPATWTGAGGWVLNPAYWALPALTFEAAAYESKAYAAGESVLFTDGATYTAHTAAAAGQPPPDAAFWGIRTPWGPVLPWSGRTTLPMAEVEGLYENDPRYYRNPGRIPCERSQEGLTPLDPLSVNRPWVRYMPYPHTLEGDLWLATTAYTAIPIDDATAL